MSTYVISDIHGFYNTFMNMLKQIDFKSDDELYIIGDVIDRGLKGVDILKYVMDKDNIHMILGNHEYMCLRYFSEDASLIEIRRWNRNGNYPTLNGFDNLKKREKNKVLKFIASLPDEKKVEVNGKKYHLVHGFIGEDTYHKVWNRPSKDDKANLPENEVLVIGHTPVCEYVCPGTDEEMFYYSHNLTKKGKHFMIYHAKNFIDIDCCVGAMFSASRLACLRLDDGKEFYEEVAED